MNGWYHKVLYSLNEDAKEFKEIIFGDMGFSRGWVAGRVTNYVDNVKLFEFVPAEAE